MNCWTSAKAKTRHKGGFSEEVVPDSESMYLDILLILPDYF